MEFARYVSHEPCVPLSCEFFLSFFFNLCLCSGSQLSALSRSGSNFELLQLSILVIEVRRSWLGSTRRAAMGNGASKVAFRDVLQQLGEEDISPEDTAFWSKLWKTESSPHVSAHRRLYRC